MYCFKRLVDLSAGYRDKNNVIVDNYRSGCGEVANDSHHIAV